MNERFKLPYTLVAVSPAEKHENYQVFVSQNFDLIAERHEDTMICGTTPVVEQRPVPPALPILIFLFDDSKVAVRRGKIDTNNKLQNNLLKKHHFNPLGIPPIATENLTKSRQTSSLLPK